MCINQANSLQPPPITPLYPMTFPKLCINKGLTEAKLQNMHQGIPLQQYMISVFSLSIPNYLKMKDVNDRVDLRRQ